MGILKKKIQHEYFIANTDNKVNKCLLISSAKFSPFFKKKAKNTNTETATDILT